MENWQSFLSYYRRFFAVFGRDFWTTWRTEAWPPVLIAFGIYVVSRHADLNAWKTFLYTAEAIGLYLAGLGMWHLVRAPWILDKEKCPAPVLSVSETMRALSTAVLDFAYERSQNAPSISTPNYVMDDAHLFLRDMRQHGQDYRAFQAYETDTKGMYEYKFKQQVDAVVKKAGLDNYRDWVSLLDTSSWLVPYEQTIKAIGHGLCNVADSLDDDVIQK